MTKFWFRFIRVNTVRNYQELRRISVNGNSVTDFSSQFHILDAWKGVRIPFHDKASISNTWGRIDIINILIKQLADERYNGFYNVVYMYTF